MICNDKISVRAKSEDKAISIAYELLKEENKHNVVINKLVPRFDGIGEVFEISYSYEKLDKDSHFEIERKFLLGEQIDLKDYDWVEINQSYIGVNPVSRVRKMGNKYYYNQKGVGTLVREENEKEITEETYNKIIKYRIGRTINKLRYRIPLDNEVDAELDYYLDDLSPLVTVEVEFKSLEDANSFVVPIWFGKEITEDVRYKNDNLAVATKDELSELLKDTKEVHLSR